MISTFAHDTLHSLNLDVQECKTLLMSTKQAQEISLAFYNSLEAKQKEFPKLSNLNPPLWEISHIAWFCEFWLHRGGKIDASSTLHQSDSLFNSSLVSHDSRWSLPYPSEKTLLNYVLDVHHRTLQILEESIYKGGLGGDKAYFVQLCLYHHQMHNEAFAYTWQFLGLPCPNQVKITGMKSQLFADSQYQQEKLTSNSSFVDDDLTIEEGFIELGSKPGGAFIFDNEKWEHSVLLKKFSISRTAVSNGAYLEYVLAQKKINASFSQPAYWQLQDGIWHEREFDKLHALNLDKPVRHISQQDAKSYAHWVGRRLPTEIELLSLFKQPLSAWMPSNLWEWTDTVFYPFPQFSADAYADYSMPWFGQNYYVLKGFSEWTAPELRRTQFRNFYTLSRYDPFCGFRTCNN